LFCSRRQLRHLISDSLVALVIVVMHGTIIMCQGMAFSVAMNSKRSSALVALLIASNFVEIKGTLKQGVTCRLWQIGKKVKLKLPLMCELSRCMMYSMSTLLPLSLL